VVASPSEISGGVLPHVRREFWIDPSALGVNNPLLSEPRDSFLDSSPSSLHFLPMKFIHLLAVVKIYIRPCQFAATCHPYYSPFDPLITYTIKLKVYTIRERSSARRFRAAIA